MKTKDIETGKRYTAKVSGQIVTVEVIAGPFMRGSSISKPRAFFDVRNEKTGRRILMSAMRIRARAYSAEERAAHLEQSRLDLPLVRSSVRGAARMLSASSIIPARHGARVATA